MTNESDKKDPKWLKTKSDGSKVIVEGSAEIPMTADTVFYNPIQVTF